MQAYAEGFDVFDKCEYELDNAKIAHLWGQGSVVRSWLCELAARAFEADGNDLAAIEGYTEDSGEGRWTIEDATDHDVPTPVITRLAVRAPALARQRRLRRPRAGRAAQPVRRPRRQERETLMAIAAEGQAGVEQENPLTRGPRAPAGRPRLARHLRRHRRPLTAQTAARALQPRPRRGAPRPLPRDRGRPPGTDGRGVRRRMRGGDPALLAASAGPRRARVAARERPLRGRELRRRRPSISGCRSSSTASKARRANRSTGSSTCRRRRASSR